MVVALCILTIDIPEASSLKDRRNLVRSIKQRVRQDFNVSVSEVGPLDLPSVARLALVSVADDSRYLNGRIDRLLDAIERRFPGMLRDHSFTIEHIEHNEL